MNALASRIRRCCRTTFLHECVLKAQSIWRQISCYSITSIDPFSLSQWSLSVGCVSGVRRRERQVFRRPGRRSVWRLYLRCFPTAHSKIVIVDSSARSMAVYQVDPAQGKLQLKSVRNLTWDLSMEQYNGLAPLPSELRLARPASEPPRLVGYGASFRAAFNLLFC